MGDSFQYGRYGCIMLPFPPSTNNLFANNRKTGGRFPTKAYNEWQDEAARALAQQDDCPSFSDKVHIIFTFGRPDKRRRDIFNLVKAPEDALVKHGIIEDDSLVDRGIVQWSDEVVGVRIEIWESP